MVLNLLNLYSFIFATFSKIHQMTNQLSSLKPNESLIPIEKLFTTTLSPETTTTPTYFQETITTQSSFASIVCFNVTIDCSTTPIALTTLLIVNSTLSSFAVPENVTLFNYSVVNTTQTDFWEYPLTNGTNTNTYDYSGENVPDMDYEESLFEAFNITWQLPKMNETVIDEQKLNTTSSYYHNGSSTGSDYEENSTFAQEKNLCIQTICVPVNNTDNITESTPSTNLPIISLGTSEPEAPLIDLSLETNKLNMTIRRKLKSLCWETMFGQELVKLTVMDLVMTVSSILMVDFFRALFIRLMNNCWCWDLEKTFPQYGDFKIAENILHLVNNQGMVWMGMFFSPLLPVINIMKLVVIMYMRSWAVLSCNIPHEVVFKASRSNNFYFALLLTMLFLCVLPVGYAIVWVEPSWHCGPFSNYKRIHHLFIRSLKKVIPRSLHKALDYIASPGIVIPLLILLILIIYYLVSLTNALREANADLKIQLRRERTEERRKVYQLADKKRRGTESSETPFAKWSKLLDSMPEGKSSLECSQEQRSENKEPPKKKDFFRRIFSNCKKDSSNTSEEGFSQLDDDKKHSKWDSMRSSIKQKKTAEPETNRHDNRNEFKQRRPREDSVASVWSADNIPQIKIEPEVAHGSKSSSADTVIAVGVSDAKMKNMFAKNKKSTEDSDVDESYLDITNSIRKMHSLTNITTES